MAIVSGDLVNFVQSPKEWETIKYYRQKYFFDNLNIKDPYG